MRRSCAFPSVAVSLIKCTNPYKVWLQKPPHLLPLAGTGGHRLAHRRIYISYVFVPTLNIPGCPKTSAHLLLHNYHHLLFLLLDGPFLISVCVVTVPPPPHVNAIKIYWATLFLFLIIFISPTSCSILLELISSLHSSSSALNNFWNPRFLFSSYWLWVAHLHFPHIFIIIIFSITS